MQRRRFIGLVGAAAAWPVGASAQGKSNPPIVAVAFPFKQDLANERANALRIGLKQAGLVEGVDYALDVRVANGDMARLLELVKELAALKPRVFVPVAIIHTPTIKQIMPDVPVVFAAIAIDPVAAGIAESYARPGGMITGVVMNAVGGEESLTLKRISILKELVPNVKRIGMIGIADGKIPQTSLLGPSERNALRKAATQLGFEFFNYDIEALDGFDAAVASGVRDEVDAFYISGDPRMNFDIPLVARTLEHSRKPACAVYPFWARAGLLMAYSNDLNDNVRRAGLMVANILRGGKPGDLPIDQAVKFKLTINQKTARSLGIAPPPALLAQADEVIE